MKKLINSLALKAALLSLPFVGLAQVPPEFQPPTPSQQFQTVTGVFTFLNTITNWLLGILIFLGVVFLIMSGVGYITAGGDQEKVKKAKNRLIYAAVGIAIGLLAKAVVALIRSIVERAA